MPSFSSSIPEPVYDRDINRLLTYYKKAFKEIANKMKVITNGIEKAQAEALLNQVGYIIVTLDSNQKRWVEETVRQAFIDGQAMALVSIGEANSLAEAAGLVAFTMLARNSVESFINDTYGDLLLATQNTERKIKQLVRNVVSDTMRLRAIEQLGRRTTKKEVVDKLTRAGLSKRLDDEAWVGIVDKSGRRWNLSTYADMVVRTKLNQAYIEGVRVETIERGVDLAVISSHGATDSCRLFEGMVISLHGLTPGYMTYAELRASGKIFHPNCSHKPFPLRDISLLPESLREKHEQVQLQAKKALSN